MKRLTRIAFAAAVISLFSSLPSMAQSALKVTFTTKFSFYAGSANCPRAPIR
jgi:hypothetical protein